MNSSQKTVYFDGKCPMCQAFQSSVTTSKQSDKFTFVDVNTGPLPADISKESALQQMHVVDEHGRIFKNADSVLAVLDEYKNFRWVVVIGRLPVIRTFLRIGYSLVAKNRYLLFGSAALRWWLKLAIVVIVVGLLYWAARSTFINGSLSVW
jgi:predicted DCC family thiol-disulfide oxidoreductase YuxK